MTKEELLSLKEFGSNMGYILNEKFTNKNAFTLRYPGSSEYDVVLDCTYNDGVTFDISTQTSYNLIHNYCDYDGNAVQYNYKNVSLEEIKNKLKEKWVEYKNYLNEIELKKIGEDFK